MYTQVEVKSVLCDRAGGTYLVETNRAGNFRSQRVVLALGGSQPRRLDEQEIEGEHLAMVERSPERSDACRGGVVLVIGGGDSAVETALDLTRRDNRVLLSYRKKYENLRANAKNLKALNAAVAQRLVLPLYESRPRLFASGRTVLHRKTSQAREVDESIKTDRVFALIGGDPPRDWLERFVGTDRSRIGTKEKDGLTYVRRPHRAFRRRRTDELVEELIGRQASPDPPHMKENPTTDSEWNDWMQHCRPWLEQWRAWLRQSLGATSVAALATAEPNRYRGHRDTDGATILNARTATREHDLPGCGERLHARPDEVTILEIHDKYRVRMPERARVDEVERSTGHALPTIRQLRESTRSR